ncbi:MAG: hypothetical protein E7163_00800 [Firmicutes bacterium]|nr:hypothetical protein [Bacillota bacterium]
MNINEELANYREFLENGEPSLIEKAKEIINAEKRKIQLEQTKSKLNECKKHCLEEAHKLSFNSDVKKYIKYIEMINQIENELFNPLLTTVDKCNCNHLYVIFDPGLDSRTDQYCCVKCGIIVNRFDVTLDNVLSKIGETKKDRYTGFICDKDLAMTVYRGIMRNNPTITDREAEKYLSACLYILSTRKLCDERNLSRIRRLGLPENFNNWKSSF